MPKRIGRYSCLWFKQPIAIIPNGINLPKTTKKYVKPDSNYHLLYLGRLHPKKGIDILLQAIATLKKKILISLTIGSLI